MAPGDRHGPLGGVGALLTSKITYKNHLCWSRRGGIGDFIIAFLGLAPNVDFQESELEGAIITNLQRFLLEMGKGYAFVARQQHIRTELDDFYIDLVFYNYILKCFVLIDLKTGRLTHQDIGQMDMYVRMYDELRKVPDDNPTLGIVLCTETDKDVAHFSVLNGSPTSSYSGCVRRTTGARQGARPGLRRRRRGRPRDREAGTAALRAAPRAVGGEDSPATREARGAATEGGGWGAGRGIACRRPSRHGLGGCGMAPGDRHGPLGGVGALLTSKITYAGPEGAGSATLSSLS